MTADPDFGDLSNDDVAVLVERCAQRSTDAEPEVRAKAVQTLGDIARTRGKGVPIARVVGLIEAARRDDAEAVKMAADVAFWELEAGVLDPPGARDGDIGAEDETIDLPSMTVAQAIRRNLRRTANFVVTRGPFRRDEWRVGWYFNPAPQLKWRLLFTTAALHVVSDDESWSVEWANLGDVNERDDGLMVKTPDGEKFVPVVGRYGNGASNDAFLVMTVLSILKPR